MEKTLNKLAIFGLGYVGCVSAACLSKYGFKIVGVDNNAGKVKQIDKGFSPIVEPDVQELVESAVHSGNLTATTNVFTAIKQTEAAFICVGTPSMENGRLSLSSLLTVTNEIASALEVLNKPYMIVFRSTVEPGTVEATLIPILKEKLGNKIGNTITIGYHPEFMREGCAVDDFFNPCKTVIGTNDNKVFQTVAGIYGNNIGRLFKTSIKTAEAIKLVDNSFHALKVAFGNEKGYQLKIYDPEVIYGRLLGENKRYTDSHLPHIMNLLVESLDNIANDTELIVLTKKVPDVGFFFDQMNQPVTVLDLVGIKDLKNHPLITYHGLYW